MDWELKEPAWELNELGPEDDPRLAALVGPSSLGMQRNNGGFSVDLKLGGLGDLREGLVDKLREPRGSTIASSPSGSSKRSKATNGMQNVSCLVDGCTADLSNCREYHRRHRVCERHSKTPVVLVCGKEQRFCQQCSRFQSLGEFDEEKRSCRKRLDGHNRRRRKPQPEAFSMSSGSFFSNYQGARLLQFGGPQACTNSTVVAASAWPSIANQQSTIPNSLASIYNGGDKLFPFLLANNPEISNRQVVPDVSSACQRLVNNNSASPERRGDYQKILPDGLAQSIDCECVRSLLSPHPMQTSEATLNHLLRGDVIHSNQQQQRQQPIGTYLHFDGLSQYSQGMEEKPPNNLCSEMFQVSPDDLLEKGASQVLPFSWK